MKFSFSEICCVLFGVPLPVYRNFSGSFENETYAWRDVTLPLCLLDMYFV